MFEDSRRLSVGLAFSQSSWIKLDLPQVDVLIRHENTGQSSEMNDEEHHLISGSFVPFAW